MRTLGIESYILQTTILFFSCAFVPGCWGFVKWIFPGPQDSNLTFNYKDIVFLTWTSNIDDEPYLYMNLWCANDPDQTGNQSHNVVKHTHVPTSGTTSESFDYNEYDEAGICHLQIINLHTRDSVDSPDFHLKSDDTFAAQTYGLSATSLLTAATQTATENSPTSFSSTGSTPLTPTSPSSPSLSSPSQPLTTAAKAGISIGSIFCAIALIIAVLLTYNAARRRRREQESKDAPGQISRAASPEIGQGAYPEIDGLGRPHELQGIPKAELKGFPTEE